MIVRSASSHERSIVHTKNVGNAALYRCDLMHELSIAYSLVEVAGQSAQEAGATKVLSVTLRLGALSGVVRGALEFGYEVATADTLLAGSTLMVKELPVRV